jgi:NAD(P)-dependent dehydrogenase (short-subunit alcohol dehydrogenase family)
VEYPDGKVPLTKGQPGTSEEVAELVLFLASERSRHITGTPVWIDGGQSLMV